MHRLQAEHREWVDREYPNQPPTIPAAGMVEEAGELLHAILKQEQQRIWGFDPRYPQLQADIVDAIGDCAIYVCSYCNADNWDFSECIATSVMYTDDLLRCATELVLQAGKFVTERTTLRMKLYVAWLRGIAHKCNLDFDTCVKETWAKVKQRRRKDGEGCVPALPQEGAD
jgi:NTP pyrophosphatase (non-canonical NTP hydrolase)